MRRVAGMVAVCGLVLGAVAGPKATVVRQKPFNLFEPGKRISFQVKGEPGEISVRDYSGRDVKFALADGTLSFDGLGPGYYEIRHAGGMNSFGVAPFVSRTAAEARKAGSRFGVKTFLVGQSGIWWRRPLTWELDECVTACERLGLQWTRHAFNIQPAPGTSGIVSTCDLVTNHQMNCVMKIEGIPESAYDAKRYGPKEDFAKTKNKKGWERCSVPLKEPYQAWLRGEIARLPKDQNVFEIGNEVWDYMTGAEFAEWCRMTVPVLREMRPGCSIGVDLSRVKWNDEAVKAGVLDGIDALYIHPYSFSPMPEVRIRAWLRNYREHFERLAGRKLDLYVTEYGWSTAPQDKLGKSCDERRQAQRTTRESLMLYAEDCKTLIPHWMGDREQDPANIEHWFGTFRLCGEPKPVIVAHAACARMIDGSVFAGDVVLPGAETGVGSMLFTRKGSWILAVWTLDENLGTGRDVTVPVRGVRAYGLMGDEIKVAEAANGVKVRANGDVTYLVGKGTPPRALTAMVDRTGELSETRWHGRIDGTVPKVTVAAGRPRPIALPCEGRRHPAAGEAAVWHDAKALHIRLSLPAVCVRDGAGTAVINFCTRPERQLSLDSYDFFDYEIRAMLKDGQTSVTVVNSALGGVLRPASSGDASGVTWTAGTSEGSYAFEIVLPIAKLNGFGGNPRGLMAGQLCWVSGDKKWLAASTLASRHYQWPLWKLEK